MPQVLGTQGGLTALSICYTLSRCEHQGLAARLAAPTRAAKGTVRFMIRFSPLFRRPRAARSARPSTCLGLLAALLPLALPTRLWAQTPTAGPTPTPTAIGQVTPPPLPTVTPEATATPIGTPLPPPVTFTVRPALGTLREGGRITVDVFLSQPLSQEATVNLSLNVDGSGLGFGAQLPFARLSASTVTLAAGQTHASVVLSAPEDNLRYTNPRVFIAAQSSAPNLLPRNVAAVTFLDNDTARLVLRPNGNVLREGSTESEPLLSVETNVRNATFIQSPAITLRSSRPDLVRVPTATLRLFALASGIFPLQVLARSSLDAPTPVTFTASGPGLPTATATVLIVDNAAPGLSVHIAPSVIDEDSLVPATGSVTRSGDTSQTLAVALSNSNPRLVRVPSSVTIPPGSGSATFAITPIESRVQDVAGAPNQFSSQRTLQAIVSASSGRLASGRARLDVRDTSPIIEAIASPNRLNEEDGPRGGVLVLRLARTRAQDVAVTLRPNDPRIVLASTAAVLPRDGRKVAVRFAIRNLSGSSLANSSEAQTFIGVADEFENPYLDPAAPDAAAPVTIVSDAPLQLRLSRGSVLISGGSAGFDVTIRRRSAGASLPVRLSAATSFFGGRGSLLLPPVVTIPAGQRSITISVRVLASSPQTYGSAILRASAGSDIASARLVLDTPGDLGIVLQADSEVLSPSSPRGTLTLRRQNFDVPATLLLQPVASPTGERAAVSAPPRIAVPAGQQFISIPLRLLRAPSSDTVALFALSVEGAPGASNGFNRIAVLVHADPPPVPAPQR